MPDNKGFNKKQIEQIAEIIVATVQPMFQPINKRLDNIETRLSSVEKDVKELKKI